MIPSLFGNPRHALLLAAFALAGIGATVWADRTSEARANRLHRADAIDEAAEIYADRVAEDPEATRLRYNYGTTLLRLGAPGAFEELTAGTTAENERQRVRAFYNSALWSLVQALVTQGGTDSILHHAATAVEANKAALRLDPEHENARWNLALAQRVLETAAPEAGMLDPGSISGPDMIGEPMVTLAPMQLTNQEGVEDVPVAGESETLAGDDLQPLSPAEANPILGTGHLDPSRIMSKMLVRESRQRRARAVFFDGQPW